MDMRALSGNSGDGIVGLIGGFHAPGRTPRIDDARVEWTSDETTLFRSDVGAFVIEDCRLLGDLTLALTVGRPTLFVIDNAVDLAHLQILQSNREIVLTPHDRVYTAGEVPAVEGLREHITQSPAAWIAAHDQQAALPATLGAFNALTKAHYSNFARRASSVAIPSVQHFWRLVGQHATLAQTLIRTAQMIRVGIEGPFRDVTPTMLFVDPGHTEEISRLALRQSTLVIAPFALPLGEPVDGVIAEFADARPEPFHLHDLITFGDRQGSTIGCLYGEYVK